MDPTDGPWAWLDNGSKIEACGLKDGDHVWVDVGDGRTPGFVGENQLIASRSSAEQPAGMDREEREGQPQIKLVKCRVETANAASMNIIGEEQLLEPSERVPDKRLTLAYSEVMHQPTPLMGEYAAWMAARKGGKDGGEDSKDEKAAQAADEAAFEAFKRLFETVNLVDMNGNKDWSGEVRGTLWSRFDLMLYIFESHRVRRWGRRARIWVSILGEYLGESHQMQLRP